MNVDLEGALLIVFLAVSAVVLTLGAVKLLFVPLAVVFELRRGTLFGGPAAPSRTRATSRPRHGRAGPVRDAPPVEAGPPADPVASAVAVSVIVPAFNEAVVLRNCVESILRTDQAGLEVIIVDDGSTDGTAAVMNGLAAEHPAVRAVAQSNAGKGAALNRGIALARGDVLVFVDADGIFAPTTIGRLLSGFVDEGVGAVCGDDRPVNLDRVQTRLLSILSHVGTGLVRRALSLLHCLPIVSGNIGAFRADLVRELGGFRTDTVGEDLELTWRVYGAGYRVVFEPSAIVLAESPSTIRGLWRQRVRWSRGLLQTVGRHRRMIGNPAFGVFGVFLAFTVATMVVVPVLQLIALGCLAVLVPAARVEIGTDALSISGWLGLLVTLALVVFAIALNGAWRDLGHLWTLPLWPVYSVFVGLTMAAAIALELRGAEAPWHKLPRTGVVSRAAVLGIRSQETP